MVKNVMVPVKADAASFILLDRSGSMSSLWDEALSSINSYVRKLGATLPLSIVTVAVFDSMDSYEIVRNHQLASAWEDITRADASPRSLTPLYDAIVKHTAFATTLGAEKTTLVIMTDGYENNSREATKDTAKAALDAARARGWDVVFLGVNWDAMAQAQSLGTHQGQTMNMAKGSMEAASDVMYARTEAYTRGGITNNASFSDKDRRAAGSDKVPPNAA